MTNRRILDMSHTERFKNLIERAERFYDEKTQFETDFGDDIPDEFKGFSAFFKNIIHLI